MKKQYGKLSLGAMIGIGIAAAIVLTIGAFVSTYYSTYEYGAKMENVVKSEYENMENILATYSQKISEELSDLKGLSSTLNNLGLIHQHKGELSEALEKFNTSLEMFKRIGTKSDIAISLINIGNIYIDIGDLDEALAKHEEALAMNRSIGAKSSIAHSMTCIGYAQYEMAEYQKVLEYEEESNKMCDEMGYKTLKIYNFYNMAEAKIEMKKFDGAVEDAHRAIDLSNELSFSLGESMGRRILGMVHREKKEWVQSIDEFKQTIDILEKIGDMRDLARTEYEFGLLYQYKGEPEPASKLLNDALTKFKEMGMKLWTDRTKDVLDDV